MILTKQSWVKGFRFEWYVPIKISQKKCKRERNWEECKILVEEDLLLLASKTKSLSRLNSCQPRIET